MIMKTALALLLTGAALSSACSRDLQAMDAQQIEQKYGVAGARADTRATDDGPIRGTLLPITLANGREGPLFISQKQGDDPPAVLLRGEQGAHPPQPEEDGGPG